MGKTGSGKTTLVEAICGLRPISSGSIVLHGRDVTHTPPAARDIGYVPQDGALFETMKVRDQLAFALRLRKADQKTIAERVDEMANLLEIAPLLDRYPGRLSGGEKQRVALGRALAFHPLTLVLDEPLSALDRSTRQDMHEILLRVKQHSHVTAIHVTHSLSDARTLADIILRVEDGQVSTVPRIRSSDGESESSIKEV